MIMDTLQFLDPSWLRPRHTIICFSCCGHTSSKVKRSRLPRLAVNRVESVVSASTPCCPTGASHSSDIKTVSPSVTMVRRWQLGLKKNCLFPVTRPTLPFHCRPYVFLPPVVKLEKKKKKKKKRFTYLPTLFFLEPLQETNNFF